MQTVANNIPAIIKEEVQRGWFARKKEISFYTDKAEKPVAQFLYQSVQHGCAYFAYIAGHSHYHPVAADVSDDLRRRAWRG
jgi:hypothetical protein